MSNNKEIVEGNKVIAEFMKLPKLTDELWINPVLASSTNHLAYHESWGWLMQVIEKIAEYHYPNYFEHYPEGHQIEPFEDCAYPRTFGMRDSEGNFMVRINASQVFSAKTLIEATWLAVIDFIKYYNEQHLK